MFIRTPLRVLYFVFIPAFLWSHQNDLDCFDSRNEAIQSEWLNSYIETNLEKPDIHYLIQTVNMLETEYCYQMDNGLIQFDTAGDPLLRSPLDGDIETDKIRMQSELRNCRDEILSRWEISEDLVLTNFPREELPDQMGDKAEQGLTLKLKEYKNRILQETDQLICYSLSRFDYIRRKDNYSLRNKSENTSAGTIAEKLINETKDELDAVNASLKNSLHNREETLVEEASLSVENWEESFQREFQKGLLKWDRAEQSFIAERIDWELSVESDYGDAEKAWDRAFLEFARHRKEWVTEISRLMEENREIWNDKKTAFTEEFERMAVEMEEAALEQEQKFAARIESCVSIYRESALMLESATENIESYQNRIASCDEKIAKLLPPVLKLRKSIEKKEAKKAKFLEYRSSLQKKLDEIKTKIIITEEDQTTIAALYFQIGLCSTLASNEQARIERKQTALQIEEEPLNAYYCRKNLYIQELGKWQNLQQSFKAQAAGAERMLYDLQAEACGYDDSVPCGSLDNEIKRISALADKLYRQWQISEAVVSYAQLNSSLRPTEAETAADMEAAETALHHSEQHYSQAIEELREQRSRVTDFQGILSSRKDEMDETILTMEAAEKRYRESMAIYQNGDTEILEKAIKNLETEILAWFSGTEETEAGRTVLYEKYLQAEEWERRIEERENRDVILRDLTGREYVTENNSLKSTEELETLLAGISTLDPSLELYDPEEWNRQLLVAGFNKDSEDYLQLSDLYLHSFDEEDSLIGTLRLFSAIEKKRVAALEKLNWNRSACTYLKKEEWEEGEDYSSFRESLKRKRDSALSSYYREKLLLLKDIALQIHSGLPGESPQKEYTLSLIKRAVMIEEDDLDALNALLQRFQEEDAPLFRESDLLSEKQIFWLGVLKGESPGGLPDTAILDLYLVDESEALAKAEQEFICWEELSQDCPAHRQDWLLQNYLNGALSGQDYMKKLSDLTTLEETLDYILLIKETDSLPEGISDLLCRYTRIRYEDELKNREADPGQYLSEIEYLQSHFNEGEYDRVMKLYEREILIENLKSLHPEPSRRNEEMAFIRKMLEENLDVLIKRTEIEAPEENSETLYRTLLSRGSIMKYNSNRVKNLKSDLALSRQSMENYKKTVVDRNYTLYQESVLTFQESQKIYNQALGHYDRLQQEVLTAQKEADKQYRTYQEAHLEHQRAREILDYAESAYSLQTMDISFIRDQRKDEHSKALEALSLLKEIQKNENTSADPDADWLASLGKNRINRSLTDRVHSTLTELSKELSSARLGLENASYNLRELITDCFDISQIDGLEFCLNTEIKNPELADCTHYANDHLEDYFKQEDISETFTRDALAWLTAIQSMENPQEVLKEFSFAYYHELQGVKVNLFEMEQHKNLLDQEGNFWRGAHIGYEGDIAKYLAGQYSDKTRVLRNYDSSIRKVLIDPYEWIVEATDPYYREIQNTPSRRNLYGFYKIMMKSELLGSKLKKALSQDLSGLAWDYMDRVSKDEQKRHKNIWGKHNRIGRLIRSKRNTINDMRSAFDGSYKRQFLPELARSTRNEFSVLRSFSSIIESRTNPGRISLSGTVSLIEDLTDRPLSSSQKGLLQTVFEMTSETSQRSFNLLLGDMSVHLNELRGITNSRIERLIQTLRDKRNSDYQMLRADYTSQRALALYRRPAYLPEEYSEIHRNSILAEECDSAAGRTARLESLGRNLIDTFHNRLERVKQDRYNTLLLDLNEIESRETHGLDRTRQLIEEGMNQWLRSTEALIGRRERWRQDFQREFHLKEALWESRYERLIKNKNEWIGSSSRDAISTGVHSMAADIGLEADRLLSEVNFLLIPEMTTETSSASEIVDKALSGTTVNRILQKIQSGNRQSADHHILLCEAALPPLPSAGRSILNLTEKQKELKEKLQKALYMAQACQMVEVLDNTDEMVEKSIETANFNVDESVEKTLLEAGYARRGDSFNRSVIIDSSLFGGQETEQHDIGAYIFYKAPAFRHGIDLSGEKLKQLDSTLIQARVQKAQENMMNYVKLIFGDETDEDDNPIEIRGGLDSRFLALLEEQEASFAASDQYDMSYTDEDELFHKTGKHLDKKGLFSYYLGYAPVMDEDKPEKVERAGYGEMGRIYKDFMIQQARLYRGLATVDAPVYSQKLWDDDADNDGSSDGFLGAPSIRSLADMTLSVVGNAFFGPGSALMVNLLDDALFTMMDVGNGVMKWGDAALGFGKKAAVSALSFGQSKLTQRLDGMSIIDETLGSKVKEVTTDIGIAGLDTAVNSYGSAAINAFNGEGEFDFDKFKSLADWNNFSTSFYSSMAGAGVRSSLDLGVFGYINDFKENGDALSSLAAGITSSGIEYALEGETKLNLLNFGMFGLEGKNGLVRSGLLELNLGGDDSLMGIGMGGTDVSLGSLAGAVDGLDVFKENRRIKEAGLDNRLTVAMRTLCSTGKDATNRAYNDILNKDTIISLLNGGIHNGETTRDSDDKKEISLNLNNKSLLDISILLNHEAFRNGLDDGVDGQIRETSGAVRQHMDVAGILQESYGREFLSDGNNREADLYRRYLRGDVSENVLEGYIGKAYDSSADFWKLTTDGRLLNDNDADLYLTNEKGEYIDELGNPVDKIDAIKLIDTETASISQALIQYIGMERASKMLGVNSGDLSNYSNQTIQDVLGMSPDLLARHAVNGQISYEDLTLAQQEKLMGELLMKENGLTWSDDPDKKWHGNDKAEFKITDNWDGYSIGFEQTMTNGEYDKFVVDIVHNRDVLSYLGSTGDSTLRKNYNAQDSSVYYKKDLDGKILNQFEIDQVQTVDNTWNENNGTSQPTGYKYPFGGIQGNTIEAGSRFTTMYGASSNTFEQMTYLLKDGLTIDGGSFDSEGNWSGFESPNRDAPWKQHQGSTSRKSFDLLFSDGCIVNTDKNTSTINQNLGNWGVYSQYNMGTIINDDWRYFYGY